MNDVFVISDNIITSLGFTTGETFANLKENISGLKICQDSSLSPNPLPLSRVDQNLLESKFSSAISKVRPDLINKQFTRLEKMFIVSVMDAMRGICRDFTQKNTLLIISSTKGNIDLLEKGKKEMFPSERIFLWKMAEVIGDFFFFANRPVIVSNACISGVLALGLASRYISSGKYENVVVAGGDLLTGFVISGFTSFQALSSAPCKPFDVNRTGLSLGEGCGTVILSSKTTSDGNPVRITGAATTNDANHISGPSRTGQELALAIERALNESGISPDMVDFVSAHGTATAYNDEMESRALSIEGMNNTPVNSFKGYWGHTLGAAGVIESVMTINSMKENLLIRSAGFDEPGVPEKINVIKENRSAQLKNSLKIASGFGGCNAALVFRLQEK